MGQIYVNFKGTNVALAAVAGKLNADLSNLSPTGLANLAAQIAVYGIPVAQTSGKPTSPPSPLPGIGTAVFKADNGTVGANFLLWAFFHGASDWVALQSVA